jgi:Family of unknown function (DUF6152)
MRSKRRWRAIRASACAGLIFSALPLSAALAHHSYAMFDGSGTRKVSGTVAKLEWKNPHVFVWIYVPSQEHAGKYDLWAFENGSPSVLSGRGWNSTSLKAGDKITLEYWPLKAGGFGGHFEKATFPDGRTLVGAGGPGRTLLPAAP